MFDCPKCHHVAHARTSRYLTENTKERYHQCLTINCSCTLMTMETIERFIYRPGTTSPDYRWSEAIVALKNFR